MAEPHLYDTLSCAGRFRSPHQCEDPAGPAHVDAGQRDLAKQLNSASVNREIHVRVGSR